MKSLLTTGRTPRLLALALGIFLFWPGARAVCDGDGVDILPFLQNGNDSKVGGSGICTPKTDNLSFLFAWKCGEGFQKPAFTKQFPGQMDRFSWQRVAASLANNHRLRGLNFMLGRIAFDPTGNLVMTFALIEGGQGKAIRVQHAIVY